MPYIVDGHNLIPKIPGLSLRAIDDEMQLIELLQEFCRVQRKALEVYFDNAPPGQARLRKYGWVTAYFIRQGTSADQAIRNRLEKLGRATSDWIVVSSDLAVQAAARRSGASVVKAEDFSRQMQKALQGIGQASEKGADTILKPDEVEAWLKFFEGESQNGED